MKYYHVEKNGNILILETKQKPQWSHFNDNWSKFLIVAIGKTRLNLNNTLNQSKNQLIETENKLQLFKENLIKNNN